MAFTSSEHQTADVRVNKFTPGASSPIIIFPLSIPDLPQLAHSTAQYLVLWTLPNHTHSHAELFPFRSPSHYLSHFFAGKEFSDCTSHSHFDFTPAKPWSKGIYASHPTTNVWIAVMRSADDSHQCFIKKIFFVSHQMWTDENARWFSRRSHTKKKIDLLIREKNFEILNHALTWCSLSKTMSTMWHFL